MTSRRSFFRKLIGVGAAVGGATVLQTAAVAEVEIQINQKHRVRVSDITEVRAIYIDGELHWVEVDTTRGVAKTGGVYNPELPKLLARIERLAGSAARRVVMGFDPSVGRKPPNWFGRV